MANMKVRLGSKGMIIALIIGVILLGGGGGYLLWRVNQPKTVAPTDSDASGGGPTTLISGWTCSPIYDVTYYLGDGTRRECKACTANTDVPTGSGCGAGGSYRYECGQYCFDGSCGKEACDNIGNPAPLPKYTLTYKAGANGRVDNPGPHTVEKGKSGPTVTAVPNSGYHFVKWNDGKTTAARTDSNVQGDATYTATFAQSCDTTPRTFKYFASANGGIEGNAEQTLKKDCAGGPSTGTPVKAITNKGWAFSHWQDLNTGKKLATPSAETNPRTDTYENDPSLFVNNTLSLTAIIVEAPNCGDGVCASTENASTCPADCPAECGDGICSESENATTCPADCPVTCGDGICSPPEENATTCPKDCPAECGDGICSEGETKVNCPVDCGSVPSTGIFDNSKHTMIFGAVILVIGLAWTWIATLPKKAYVFVSNTSDNVSKYVSDVKKKKEKNIRDNRRSRLERKIK